MDDAQRIYSYHLYNSRLLASVPAEDIILTLRSQRSCFSLFPRTTHNIIQCVESPLPASVGLKPQGHLEPLRAIVLMHPQTIQALLPKFPLMHSFVEFLIKRSVNWCECASEYFLLVNKIQFNSLWMVSFQSREYYFATGNRCAGWFYSNSKHIHTLIFCFIVDMILANFFLRFP